MQEQLEELSELAELELDEPELPELGELKELIDALDAGEIEEGTAEDCIATIAAMFGLESPTKVSAPRNCAPKFRCRTGRT